MERTAAEPAPIEPSRADELRDRIRRQMGEVDGEAGIPRQAGSSTPIER
jgi:hypothetical protein